MILPGTAGFCRKIPRLEEEIPMKRIFTMLFAAALLLSLAGCGGEPAETTVATEPPVTAAQPTAQATEEPTQAPTEPPAKAYPMARTVLVDDENCAFTILGATCNDYTGMEIQVACQNKTEKTMMFSWDAVSVCGYMYDPHWAQEVGPGETVDSIVSIDTYALEGFGILSVDEISFHLYIFDNDNWMDEPFADSYFDIYPTGLTADTVSYPHRENVPGETVIADDRNLTFIIECADTADDLAFTLHCYLENKTDSTVMFSWDAVAVNGCQLYPGWAETVAPGKSAYSDVVFYRSDLAENGIGEVSQIEFNLIVSDYEDWASGYLMDSIFTYEPVYEEPAG